MNPKLTTADSNRLCCSVNPLPCLYVNRGPDGVGEKCKGMISQCAMHLNSSHANIYYCKSCQGKGR